MTKMIEKSLLLVVSFLLWICSTSNAFRIGLIRIPNEEEQDVEAVYREFGNSPFHNQMEDEDMLLAFRELYHDWGMSMSLSMSMSHPTTVKVTAAPVPTATPLPPSTPTPVLADITEPPVPVWSDAPSLLPSVVGDMMIQDNDVEDGNSSNSSVATTTEEKSAVTETGAAPVDTSEAYAPQTALLTLLSLAAVTAIVALIARKVYLSRQKRAGVEADSKSLSDSVTETHYNNTTNSNSTNLDF